MSGEGEAALLADAVGRYNKDVVLGGADFRRVLPGIGSARPVGRDGKQLRTLQFHGTTRLGKAAVVADIHAELAIAGLKEREGNIAESGEAVHPKMKQVDLAVHAEDSSRSNDQG